MKKLLAPELASGITRGRALSRHSHEELVSLQQAQALLNTPDATTRKGLRDRAMFAVLLGCGLRRSEVPALTVKHIQQRDGRWCFVDLIGKHGRVRTVPMPAWTKSAIDSWTTAAEITAIQAENSRALAGIDGQKRRYGQPQSIPGSH